MPDAVIVEPGPKLEEPPTLSPKRPPRSSILILAGVVCVAIVFAFLLFSRSSPQNKPTPTGPSTAGLDGEIRIKGTTEASQSRTIVAPSLAGQSVPVLTVTRLIPSGARVKRGDLLAEFDRQAQIQDSIDKESEYRKLVDQVKESQANEDAARAKDEAELAAANNALKKAQLEMQKLELMSRIDAEKAQQTLQEAKATADELKTTFDLKRNAARAGIRILEIQRDRAEQTMKHAQQNANLLRIVAPIDGIVVLNSIWKGGTMGETQEGDQLRPGTPFMQVVDPSHMQIKALINQQDYRELSVGQTAKVRVDAYSDLVLRGNLVQISPVARQSSFSDRVRTFSAIFSIEGSDPRLMPDLSAALDVHLNPPAGGSQ
jgi:multidrug resistance efflux pump